MSLHRAGVLLASAGVVLGSTLVAVTPAAAVTVTWVSGVGDDANPCSRTAPCKTFAGAISKTEEGGTIIALDSGGFGSVTITKSITIDGAAVEAGVLNSNTWGVTVNAGADDKVILRNLDIYAAYTAKADASACSVNGVHGVRVLNAGTVQLDSVNITGQATTGVLVAPTASNPTVAVADSVIRNGCGPAVQATPAVGFTAAVNVLRSTLSTNDVGVAADENGTVKVMASSLFGNGTATRTTGNGSIDISDPATHVLANSPILKPNSPNVTAGATRTWVSGTGNDANPCSRTAPCQTFAGAYVKTATGGQINVLDNGSFGPVTIGKAITIDATGASATINSGGATSILIDAPATQDVILRGLTITGTPGGTPTCPFAPQSGVTILGGRTVHIEESAISGFSATGISVAPTAASTRVVVDSTTVSNVCGTGINVAPLSGQATPVLIQESELIDNGTGVAATAGGQVFLVDTFFARNTVPTSAAGGSITVESPPGGGCTVILHLPSSAPLAETPAPQTPAPTLPS